MPYGTISIETDLDYELKFNPLLIELTAAELTVRKENEVVRRIPLSFIAKVLVEKGTGVDKLVAEDPDGKASDIAFFSKAKSEEFRSFAASIGQLKSGNPSAFQNSVDIRTDWKRAGTLRWLLNFMRPHMKMLLTGILLSVVIAGLSLVGPYLLKILVDGVLTARAPSSGLLTELTLALLASYAVMSIFQGLQTFVLNTTGQKIVNELRGRLFSHVITHTSAFIDRISTGRIISRLTTDVGNTQWLMVWGMPSLTVNILTIFGIGVILFTMDAYLALYVLAPAPVIILILVNYRKKSHKLYHKNWRRNADVISRFSDIIPNYVVVKSSAREQSEIEDFDSLLGRLYDSQRSVMKMNSLYWPAIGLLTSLATVAIWWEGGNQVIASHIQLGIIVSFIAFLTLFYQPINNLSNVIPFIQQAITSGERIREVLEVEPEIKSSKEALRPSTYETLSLKDVGFSYEKYSPVVRDFSMIARAGEKIAIAGKSGSGKSTIAKLIMRFYEADVGAISFDGIDIRDIELNHLRSHIGYVPQESVLFDASVAYNIRYGSVREAGNSEIIAAAAAAGMHEEIMQLPLAYYTNLGERGNFLSGGQKQRLAIARAIFKDPEIVVFDEATSNLDVVNERLVFDAIEALSRNRTSIFITHNLKEVLSSDWAIVMENGRIVQEGKPADLIKAEGSLYSMFKDDLANRAAESNRRRENGEKKLMDYASHLLGGAEDGYVCQPNGRSSRVNISGSALLVDLVPRLPFPISAPELVIFYSEDNGPILMCGDYRKDFTGGLQTLEFAIRMSNLMTPITKLRKIALTGEELEWYAVTAEGAEITVRTKGRRNVILMNERIVLVDVNENIFELRYESLDKKTRKLVSQVL